MNKIILVSVALIIGSFSIQAQKASCKSLLVASKSKNIGQVAHLLKTVKPNCIYRSGEPRTALVAASRNGSLQIVKLIKKKASVNKAISGEGTALISAVKNSNYQIAKILLENGADVDLAVRSDEYPMYHAKMKKNIKMITLLKKHQ
jgi:ankyrin repeat protein